MGKIRLKKDTLFTLHLEQARIKSLAIQSVFRKNTLTDADLIYYATFIMGFDPFNQTHRAELFLRTPYYRKELESYVNAGRWPAPKQRLEFLPWFALAYPNFPIPVNPPSARVPRLLPLDLSNELRLAAAQSRDQLNKEYRKLELKRLRALKKKKAAKAALHTLKSSTLADLP